jgi:4,5-DOPA dioxygenase extradiol
MKMPVLFVGHGSPMNALVHNEWTRTLKQVADRLPKPEAIVCVSAHWQTRGVKVEALEHPKTIHDFYGFPEELSAIRYPADGDVALAEGIASSLRAFQAETDQKWGLDHGTWSVLVHMYPEANIPVLQLSLDRGLSERGHWEVGKALRELREKNVLILGSGNIVHNLRLVNWREQNPPPFPWNIEFDRAIAKALEDRDTDLLVDHARRLPEISRLAVPTNEHYHPLLSTYGASDEEDRISFPFTGYEMASLSMRMVLWENTKS